MPTIKLESIGSYIEPIQFDTVNGYENERKPHYLFFQIIDTPKWTAIVCYDLKADEAVAVKNPQVSLKEATNYIRGYLKRPRVIEQSLV